MNLGFHYHIPMKLEGKALFTSGYLGRFIDSLAENCAQLACFMHSPRADELEQMDYCIKSSNVEFVDIGAHSSVPKRLLKSHHVQKIVSRHSDQLDAMLIRGPSPLLPAIANAVGDLPIALLLVGDYLAGINDLPQPRWRKELIRLWSYWNYIQQKKVAKHSLTFVNSRQLFEQLRSVVPNLVETRTTTLSEEDFYIREDTCQNLPIRLLYTGRMDRAKGLFEMVEAVQILRQQGQDVMLDFVGWPAKNDTVVEELKAFASQLKVADYVIYHGYKPVGEELFRYYKQADIYLIASQSSEGFPRTIWEAMAHSLPVIATRVGSIPHFLRHQRHALLVEPRNSAEIAKSIKQYVYAPAMRRSIIDNALKLAKDNTLEVRSIEMVTSITAWLNSAHQRCTPDGSSK